MTPGDEVVVGDPPVPGDHERLGRLDCLLPEVSWLSPMLLYARDSQ